MPSHSQREEVHSASIARFDVHQRAIATDMRGAAAAAAASEEEEGYIAACAAAPPSERSSSNSSRGEDVGVPGARERERELRAAAATPSVLPRIHTRARSPQQEGGGGGSLRVLLSRVPGQQQQPTTVCVTLPRAGGSTGRATRRCFPTIDTAIE